MAAPTKARLEALTELVSTLDTAGLQVHLVRQSTDPPGDLSLTLRDHWSALYYQLPSAGGHTRRDV